MTLRVEGEKIVCQIFTDFGNKQVILEFYTKDKKPLFALPMELDEAFEFATQIIDAAEAIEHTGKRDDG